jgi:hypothetical protein
MGKNLLPGILLIAALLSSLAAQTQSSQSELASKIKDAIKSKEPNWEFSSPRREADANSTYYHWKSGQEDIECRVFVTDSQQAATAKLNEYAHHVPIPPKERLKTPGDEALLFQGVNTDGCMILFRRGNIFVHLNGTSVVNAKRFAKHLDDLFRSSKNE